MGQIGMYTYICRHRKWVHGACVWTFMEWSVICLNNCYKILHALHVECTEAFGFAGTVLTHLNLLR